MAPLEITNSMKLPNPEPNEKDYLPAARSLAMNLHPPALFRMPPSAAFGVLSQKPASCRDPNLFDGGVAALAGILSGAVLGRSGRSPRFPTATGGQNILDAWSILRFGFDPRHRPRGH